MKKVIEPADPIHREVPITKKHHIQVMFIGEEEAWCGVPCIRLRMRQDTGRLLPGPDIPLESVGAVIQALIEVIPKE